MDLSDELRWQAWIPDQMTTRMVRLATEVATGYVGGLGAWVDELTRGMWVGRLEAIETMLFGAPHTEAIDNIYPGTYESPRTARRAGVVADMLQECVSAPPLPTYGSRVRVDNNGEQRVGTVAGMVALWTPPEGMSTVFQPALAVRYGGAECGPLAVELVPLGRAERCNIGDGGG